MRKQRNGWGELLRASIQPRGRVFCRGLLLGVLGRGAVHLRSVPAEQPHPDPQVLAVQRHHALTKGKRLILRQSALLLSGLKG
jgi:hypothetical protein